MVARNRGKRNRTLVDKIDPLSGSKAAQNQIHIAGYEYANSKQPNENGPEIIVTTDCNLFIAIDLICLRGCTGVLARRSSNWRA